MEFNNRISYNLQTKVKLQEPHLIGKFLRRELGMNEEIDHFYFIPENKKYVIDKYNKNNLNSPIIENDILSWGLNLIITNKKGNNTVIYTRPSSECPKGRVSETLLELICLKYLGNDILELVLSRDARSKNRIIKTYTSDSQSLEPFIAPITRKFFNNPKLVYSDENKEKNVAKIDYNIPSFLLEDFSSQRISSRRSRVDKEELQKMSILTKDGKLTDLAELLLYSFESWMIREAVTSKTYELIPDSYKISISFLIDVYLEKKTPISKVMIQEMLKTHDIDLVLENILENIGVFRWRWLDNNLDVFESDSPWISIKSKLDLWSYLKPGYVYGKPLDFLTWEPIDGLLTKSLEEINQKPPPQAFLTLTGDIGIGKSILIGQIALEGLKSGIDIFFINPERDLPEKWPFNKEVLVLIDDLDKLPNESLKKIGKWLLDPILPNKIIATIRKPLLNPLVTKLNQELGIPSIEERWGIIQCPNWKSSQLTEMVEQLSRDLGVELGNFKERLLSFGGSNPTIITYPLKLAHQKKRDSLIEIDFEPPMPYILKITRLLTDLYVDKQGYWKDENSRIIFEVLNGIAHQKFPMITKSLLSCLLEELNGNKDDETILSILEPVAETDEVWEYKNLWWAKYFFVPANDSFDLLQSFQKRISYAFFSVTMATKLDRFSIFEGKRLAKIGGEVALIGSNYVIETFYPALHRAASKAIQNARTGDETWGIVIQNLHSIPTPATKFSDFFPPKTWEEQQMDIWVQTVPMKNRLFILNCLLNLTEIKMELPMVTDFPSEIAFKFTKYISPENYQTIAFTKLNWAYILAHRDNFTESDSILNEVLLLLATFKQNNSFLAIRSLITKGSNQKDQKEYNKARYLYEEALKRVELGKTELESNNLYILAKGQVLFRLGFLAYMEKKFLESESILENAITILELCNPNPPELIQVLETQGKVKEKIGKESEAVNFVNRAILLSETIGAIDYRLELLRMKKRIELELEDGQETLKETDDIINKQYNEILQVLKFDPKLSPFEKQLMEIKLHIDEKDYITAVSTLKNINETDELPDLILLQFLRLQRDLYLELRNFPEIVVSLNQLINLLRKINELQDEIVNLELLANIQLHLGQIEESCKCIVDLIHQVELISKSKRVQLLSQLENIMKKENFKTIEGTLAKAEIIEDKLIFKNK